MLNDNDLTAERKITKARSQLIMDDPFFGNVAMHLDIMPDLWGILPPHAKTMATDGERLIYDINFVDTIDVQEAKFGIVHEVGHVALKHHLRRGKRDFATWNQACDQAVNHILIDAGYHMPKSMPMPDPAFKDMGAEQIYQIMLAGQNSGNSGQSPKPHTDPVKLPPKDSSGQPGPTQPDSLPGSGKPGPGKSGKNQQGQQKGGNPSGPPQPQQIPDVPNANGGLILDAPVDLNDLKEFQQAEENVDLIVEQAAKTAGNLPGSLNQIVKSNKEHTQNYRDLLRDFLEESLTPGDYTWEVPDRMWTAHDIFLPGIEYEPELPQIIFAIDTSGSIGRKEKDIFANEISGVLEEFPCTIKAMYCDTSVRHTQDLDSDDLPIDLQFRGGGGTQFYPVFDYIKEHDLQPKAILYFSDMEVWSWDRCEDPGVPVLWMNTNRRKDDCKVPFGKIIPLELDKQK